MSRYRRKVPKWARDLIRRHRLARPNWYVGSAESWGMAQEAEEAKARMRAIIAEQQAAAPWGDAEQTAGTNQKERDDA